MPDLSTDLTGKSAIVTGSSMGIGRAIALGLARCGAAVAVNCRRSEAEAAEVVDEIEASGGRAIAVRADVSESKEVEALFGRTIEAFGRLDILVNNAGGTVKKALVAEMTEEVWDQTIKWNLKSVFLCCRAAIPLLPDGTGRIINIASMSGHTGGGMLGVPYGAAKGAMMTMTRALALDLARRSITVNALAPGIIDTRIHEQFTSPEEYEMLVQRTPLQRDGKPHDLVGAVLLLASEDGSFITGQIIHVNGGILMV